MIYSNTYNDRALDALRDEVVSLDAKLSGPYYKELERPLQKKQYLEYKKARLDEGELPNEDE